MTDWNESDAQITRVYLETQAGQKYLSYLERVKSEGLTFETVALNARYQDGVDFARNTIKWCAAFVQRRTVESTQTIDFNEK